jgi:hypothetical protein
MFVIQTKPSYEDMVEIARLRMCRPKNIILILITVLLCNYAISLDIVGGLIFTGIMLAAFLSLWFFLPIIVKSKWSKNEFNKNIIITYTFSDDGSINIVTTRDDRKVAEFNLEVKDITKIKETRKLVLIYVSKRQVFYINKSFLTAEQIDTIRKACFRH